MKNKATIEMDQQLIATMRAELRNEAPPACSAMMCRPSLTNFRCFVIAEDWLIEVQIRDPQAEEDENAVEVLCEYRPLNKEAPQFPMSCWTHLNKLIDAYSCDRTVPVRVHECWFKLDGGVDENRENGWEDL